MTFLLNGLALAVWTVDTILSLASPADPQIRTDGKRVAYVYRGEIFTIDAKGGAEKRIGLGSRPRWVPGTELLSYLASDGQVHFSDGRVATKSPTPISSYSVASRGDVIYYLATEALPPADPIVAGERLPHSRLYRQALAGGEPHAISDLEWHVASCDVSPDGGRTVCAVQRSPLASDVFHVDLYETNLATGNSIALVAQPGRDADPSYSPDGRSIAFHTQGGTWNYFEARNVAVVPSGGGTVRLLSAGTEYDVFRNGNQFVWSKDSLSLIYTAGRGTMDMLLRQDLRTQKITPIAERISGNASFNADGSTGVYLKSSSASPPEIVRLSEGTETPITKLQDHVADLPAIASKVVRWRSTGGLEIEGVLWLPVGYRTGQRVPVLAELHGGPAGVALHSFPMSRTFPTQLFLQYGIAVFAPNFRGSSNYGAAFRLKNALSQGIGDYQDVMTGIDYLIAEGIADPERLGVMGWSYGGYLTGAMITQTKRFRAASIGAPAVDWTTYYGQFDGSKEVLWTYFGGTPWEVPQNYIRHSTRAGLRNIRTPTLLLVGQRDLNHCSEIYQALTDLRVPVEYVIYPREGHGIAEPAHQRDLLERNFRWFMRWLNPR